MEERKFGVEEIIAALVTATYERGMPGAEAGELSKIVFRLLRVPYSEFREKVLVILDEMEKVAANNERIGNN